MSHKYNIDDRVKILSSVAEKGKGFYWDSKKIGQFAVITEQVMDDEDFAYTIKLESSNHEVQALQEDIELYVEPKKTLTKLTVSVTLETDNASDSESYIRKYINEMMDSVSDIDMRSIQIEVTYKEEIEEFSEESDEDNDGEEAEDEE